MKPKAILRELKRARGGFPEAALREALAQREAIEPQMLEALRDTPKQLRARGDDWMLHHFALYLTAAWRTPQALPLIIDFFVHPGEQPMEITGDYVTEALARTLASVAHGRLGPIRRLVADPRVNEWSRSAGINAVVIMELTGQLAEGEAEAFLRSLASGGLEDVAGVPWCTLATACGRLHLAGMLPDIERAYARDLIDPAFIRLEDVKESLANPGDRNTCAPPSLFETLIDDPVADLARFDWSEEKPAAVGDGDRELAALVTRIDELAQEGMTEAVCAAYQAVWASMKLRLTPAMSRFEDLDAVLPKGVFTCNLVFEYLIELENAALDDPQLAGRGIAFCEFIRGQFTGMSAHDEENVRGAQGSLHFRAGDAARGATELRALIADRPHRSAGYVLLADALGFHRYAWHGPKPLDPARAFAVLEEAAAAGVDDADDWDLASRLNDMREQAGRQ